jgi:hypothetical protein
MTNSKQIAGLVGPTLIVMTISESLNAQIWANVPATQTYLAGLLWFVAGLAIVRVHNDWIRDWSVAVTIVGWFLMLGGLGRMFFPVAAQQSTPSGSVVLALQIVLLAIGIFLTFNAFRDRGSGTK